MNEKDNKIWQLLENFKPIEPPTNFNTLFWEKVKQGEKEAVVSPPLFVFPRLNPRLAYVMASMVIIISLTFAFKIKQQSDISRFASSFKNSEEIEMVKNLDVLKDMDIVQNMDLLENYEVIQNLEETTAI